MISLARFMRNLGSRDPDRRLFALKSIADRLIHDFRLSWHQMEWWGDPDFNAFLDRFGERRGFNTHRRWMLWQLLRLIRDVPGDTAECGVFEGSSSWLICAAIQSSGRTHHLFDSFEGLSSPGPQDGSYWKQHDLAANERAVAQNLAHFAGFLEFHKGWIPERFSDVERQTFSFVHVDVDLYQPTLDSVAFFYPRLSPGAILLCDDYACTTCPGATEAIDSFLADKPEKMLRLDAGGGFFIRGVGTAPPAKAMAEAGVRQT
jgi:hypothetical protein